MERNVEDILAELRAKRAAAEKPEERPAAEAPVPAEPVPVPESPELPAEEPAPLPEKEEEPAPLPIEEPAPRPAAEPGVPAQDVFGETAEKVKKGVDDLYVGSFGEKAYKADRLEKRRARKNRDALVVKESGKTGFFGGLFRLVGFLVVVALTILAVLIGLQFIADVEIIPVKAIVESIIAWLEGLLAKWGM